MRFKTNIIAGLVTVIVAVAAFVLMGSLLSPEAEHALSFSPPESALFPAATAETIMPDTVDESTPQYESELPESAASSGLAEVRDIHITADRVWVATPGGLIQTDGNGTYYRVIETAKGLEPKSITEIVDLPGRTLFAADHACYEYLGPDVFRRVELPLVPPITFCHAFDSLSYIAGYENGVFKYTPEVPVLLKDDILVTALAFSSDGLWVGTEGDGLWRLDGHKWQRRFMHPDTGAFDFVTALAYRWPHLMVGTPDGVYRYDGGKWEMYYGQDSTFPGGQVTALAFANHRWYIGTVEHGLWTLLDSTFAPVEELAGSAITCIKVFRNDVYVGTEDAGVYVHRAGRWQQLYQIDGMPEIPRTLLTLM
jgi:hypothetical protein